MKKVEDVNAYEIIEKIEIKDINSMSYLLKHKKTGARIALLSNDDDNKVFYIITDKPLEVRDYVIDKLHYNVTVVKARGGYSNKRKKMLMCVVPTIEYVKLKEIIREIDNKAFFLIVDTYEASIKKNCKNM